MNTKSLKNTWLSLALPASLLLPGASCAGGEYNTARPGAKESSLEIAGAKLHTWEYPGEKPTILLLHGGPGVPDYLADVARLLNNQGHRVIAYDQRGSGASIARNDSLKVADHVEDLENLRKKFGLEKLNLLGHSWGGTLAQAYALAYPELTGSLFLTNSGAGFGQDWEEMESAVMNYNRKKSGLPGFAAMGLWSLVGLLPGSMGDAGVRNLFARVWKNYGLNPTTTPDADPNWLAGIRGGPAHQTRNDAASRDAEELSNLSRKLADTPVLILFGERDIYGETREKLLKRFPDAQKIILKNSGHLPWLENPAEFENILRDFYGKLTPAM